MTKPDANPSQERLTKIINELKVLVESGNKLLYLLTTMYQKQNPKINDRDMLKRCSDIPDDEDSKDSPVEIV